MVVVVAAVAVCNRDISWSDNWDIYSLKEKKSNVKKEEEEGKEISKKKKKIIVSYLVIIRNDRTQFTQHSPWTMTEKWSKNYNYYNRRFNEVKNKTFFFWGNLVYHIFHTLKTHNNKIMLNCFLISRPCLFLCGISCQSFWRACISFSHSLVPAQKLHCLQDSSVRVINMKKKKLSVL